MGHIIPVLLYICNVLVIVSMDWSWTSPTQKYLQTIKMYNDSVVSLCTTIFAGIVLIYNHLFVKKKVKRGGILTIIKIVTDMQFNYHHNVKSDIAVVTFTGFNISKVAAKEKLFENLRIIGGEQTHFELEWTFPDFITAKVIERVISNTCFVCGGLMKDSTAYKNDDILHNERIVWKDSGIARQIKVRKCSSCGHSHT